MLPVAGRLWWVCTYSKIVSTQEHGFFKEADNSECWPVSALRLPKPIRECPQYRGKH
jgi:hypothetical protein